MSDLFGADQGYGGEVFSALGFGEGEVLQAVPRGSAEVVGLVDCGLAQLRRGAEGGIFDDVDDALLAEVGAALAGFEDALGDEEQAGAGLQCLDGWLVGHVSEEAKGYRDVAEGSGAVGVAEDGGRSAGIDVCEEAERNIETADEGGGEARAAGGVVDGQVDLVGEGGEGVHEIDAVDAEELRRLSAEDVLNACGDGVGFVALTGDVGEEKNDVGADDDGVKEVAASAGGVVARIKIEARERRQNSGQRGACGLGCVLHVVGL